MIRSMCNARCGRLSQRSILVAVSLFLISQGAHAQSAHVKRFFAPYGTTQVVSLDHSKSAYFTAEYPPALYVTDLLTGEKKMVAKSPGGPASWMEVDSLAFSPDGARLIFAAGPPRQYTGAIYTVRTDGSDLKKLAENVQLADSAGYVPGQIHYDMEVFDPVFSPDGARIAVGVEITNGERDEEGHIEDGLTKTYVGLLSTETQNQKPERLAEGKLLFWSADGRDIYFVDDLRRFCKVSATTKAILPLANANGVQILGRIPGTDTVFLKDQNGTQVKILSLNGSAVGSSLQAFAAQLKVADSEGRNLDSIQYANPQQATLHYSMSLPPKDPGMAREREEQITVP